MDFYGGYKTEAGGVGLDFGVIYYYPGSGKGGTSKIDNAEVYVGASYGRVSLKYSHAVSDFFSVPDTKGTGYLDLGFTQDLGGGCGVNAHAGYQKVRNTPGKAGKITDYKIGVTYDLSGFVLGTAYIGTNRDGIFFGPQSGKDLAKGTAVVSVIKSF